MRRPPIAPLLWLLLLGPVLSAPADAPPHAQDHAVSPAESGYGESTFPETISSPPSNVSSVKDVLDPSHNNENPNVKQTLDRPPDQGAHDELDPSIPQTKESNGGLDSPADQGGYDDLDFSIPETIPETVPDGDLLNHSGPLKMNQEEQDALDLLESAGVKHRKKKPKKDKKRPNNEEFKEARSESAEPMHRKKKQKEERGKNGESSESVMEQKPEKEEFARHDSLESSEAKQEEPPSPPVVQVNSEEGEHHRDSTPPDAEKVPVNALSAHEADSATLSGNITVSTLQSADANPQVNENPVVANFQRSTLEGGDDGTGTLLNIEPPIVAAAPQALSWTSSTSWIHPRTTGVPQSTSMLSNTQVQLDGSATRDGSSRSVGTPFSANMDVKTPVTTVPPPVPREKILSRYLHDVFKLSNTHDLVEKIKSGQSVTIQDNGAAINLVVTTPGGGHAPPASPIIPPTALGSPSADINPFKGLVGPVISSGSPLYFINYQGQRLPVYPSDSMMADTEHMRKLQEEDLKRQQVLFHQHHVTYPTSAVAVTTQVPSPSEIVRFLQPVPFTLQAQPWQTSTSSQVPLGPIPLADPDPHTRRLEIVPPTDYLSQVSGVTAVPSRVLYLDSPTILQPSQQQAQAVPSGSLSPPYTIKVFASP